MLNARNLGKTYSVADKEAGLWGTVRHFVHRQTRDIVAVSGVNFELQKGEVVGFVGANGAGKTTTLKMLSGLIRPTTGSVRVAGYDPFRRDPALLRQITLVMGQKQQLIWDLPALDSLRINAAVYELSASEAKQRIGELSEMLEVGSLLTQPVRKLSLGERMKCELLAALLHRPQLLFLDEPTLGLDINAQEAIRTFLREYNQRYGASVLLTSHYMADITALCDRVMVIHGGRLVFDGPLSQLTSRLSPLREVEVHLSVALERTQLERFGEVLALNGAQVTLAVQQSQLRDTVAGLFRELEPVDLTVRQPSIESVLGPLLSGQTVLDDAHAEAEPVQGRLESSPSVATNAKAKTTSGEP